jgi:hypothetical protein
MKYYSMHQVCMHHMGEVGRDARSWESKCGISVVLDKGVMIIHQHEHDPVSQANIKVLQANI